MLYNETKAIHIKGDKLKKKPKSNEAYVEVIDDLVSHVNYFLPFSSNAHLQITSQK